MGFDFIKCFLFGSLWTAVYLNCPRTCRVINPLIIHYNRGVRQWSDAKRTSEFKRNFPYLEKQAALCQFEITWDLRDWLRFMIVPLTERKKPSVILKTLICTRWVKNKNFLDCSFGDGIDPNTVYCIYYIHLWKK